MVNSKHSPLPPCAELSPPHAQLAKPTSQPAFVTAMSTCESSRLAGTAPVCHIDTTEVDDTCHLTDIPQQPCTVKPLLISLCRGDAQASGDCYSQDRYAPHKQKS